MRRDVGIPPYIYARDIEIKKGLLSAPSDEGAGFLRSKKTEGLYSGGSKPLPYDYYNQRLPLMRELSAIAD